MAFGKKPKPETAPEVSTASAPAVAPPETGERLTLATSGLPAALSELQAEHTRLTALIEAMTAHYERHENTNLIDAQTRYDVLQGFYTQYTQAGPPQADRPIYRLIAQIGPECQSVQTQAEKIVERREQREAQRAAAAAEAERVRAAEAAEVERLTQLFARHGKTFPPVSNP